MKNPITIAVDGFSSCGKSTFAKAIARKVGYLYIDSGAMYRAVTLACIRNGIATEERLDLNRLPEVLNKLEVGFIKDEEGDNWLTTLNGEIVEEEIRSLMVSKLVSPVSAVAAVRTIMTKQQQEMGKQKGIVMDGRDIGTVVFPDAELKIFMTASPTIRAERRLKELLENGKNATFEEVLANVQERDLIDQTRKVAPLRQASDAIVLDNSTMTIDEQMEWFERIFKSITEKE